MYHLDQLMKNQLVSPEPLELEILSQFLVLLRLDRMEILLPLAIYTVKRFAVSK
jgi:hypothetical protein